MCDNHLVGSPPSGTKASRHNSPNLDILRAIAVLTVVVDHLIPTFGFRGYVIPHTVSELTLHIGQSGVLAFFVHTSLVLMYSLERIPAPSHWAQAWRFYVRHAFRIYPLAIVCVIIVDHPELAVRRSVDGRIWVAGIPVSSADNADSTAADWVFSQPELVIRHGTVTWTDELRNEPTIALTDVDWVLRNQHRSHSMRLDANPPAHWGGRLSVAGIFRQPLLSRSASRWREWQGQLFATFAQVDLAELRRYADLGVDLAQGAGSVRAWVDVSRGVVTGATADLALDDVMVTLSPKLEPLALRGVTGRLGARRLDGGGEVSTQALQFETAEGVHAWATCATTENGLLRIVGND